MSVWEKKWGIIMVQNEVLMSSEDTDNILWRKTI